MLGIPRLSVLVCGGRDFDDKRSIYAALDYLSGPYTDEAMLGVTNLTVIEGGARGADRIAGDWAVVNWCGLREIRADWHRHGKAAGPIRNKQMLDMNPDVVLAFPGGPGTANMIAQTLKAGYTEGRLGWTARTFWSREKWDESFAKCLP